MDQLACLKAFVAVVQNGSVRAAAEKLHQTDAAISKKLTKLEESVKLNLIDRKRGQWGLTPVGHHYYDICQKALDQLDSANQLVRAQRKEPSGSLSVATNRFYFQKYIAPKLPGFLKDYSNIRLTIETNEELPDFTSSELDISFGWVRPLPNAEKWVRRKIGTTRNIVFASPQYLKNKSIKKPKDLVKLHYIAHCDQHPVGHIAFDDGLSVDVTPFLRVDDTQTGIECALGGLGYMSIREYSVAEHLKTKKLVELFPELNRIQMPIYLYYRHQAYLDPKIPLFIDYFLKELVV